MDKFTENELAAIQIALETKSWHLVDDFISEDDCRSLISLFKSQSDNLSTASIGKNISLSNNIDVRKSQVKWITNWEESLELKSLYSQFSQLYKSLNQYFMMTIKHFESQWAYYNKGDYYKKHLDKFSKDNHRRLSCCLYLSDSPQGGELVIYNKNSELKIDSSISPKRGRLVVFFAEDIYHEVKTVEGPRYSITTWFRDDLPL